MAHPSPAPIALSVIDSMSRSRIRSPRLAPSAVRTALSRSRDDARASRRLVTFAATTSPYVDSSVSLGNCYKYQYAVSDAVGNQAIYTSASIAKVPNSARISASASSSPA